MYPDILKALYLTDVCTHVFQNNMIHNRQKAKDNKLSDTTQLTLGTI